MAYVKIVEELVDVEQADAALHSLEAIVNKPENRPELEKAEGAVKNSLHGLILTAIQEGLITNDAYPVTRWRAKLFMSFEFGYFLGKKTERRRTFMELQERFPNAVFQIKSTMSTEDWLVFSGQR